MLPYTGLNVSRLLRARLRGHFSHATRLAHEGRQQTSRERSDRVRSAVDGFANIPHGE